MRTNCPTCKCEVVTTPQHRCPWCSTSLAEQIQQHQQQIQQQIDSVATAATWTQIVRDLQEQPA